MLELGRAENAVGGTRDLLSHARGVSLTTLRYIVLPTGAQGPWHTLCRPRGRPDRQLPSDRVCPDRFAVSCCHFVLG